MARNLASIRTDVREIVGQTDSSDSHFTNSRLDVWINEGYRRVCIALQTGTIKERKYTTADTITLNTGTVTIDVIKFLKNDGTNTKWIELSPIDIADLASRNANWENEPAGTPRYCVKFGQFDARLFPPLDANNTGQAEGFKTYGLELPTELSGDSDETAFAHHLDDLISHFAAYRAFSRIGDTDRSTIEFRAYRGMLKEEKAMATKWSRGRQQWTFHDTDGSDTRNVRIE